MILLVCLLTEVLVLSGCEGEAPTDLPGSYGSRDINTFKYLGEFNIDDDFMVAAGYDLLILNEVEAVPEKITKIHSYNPHVKIILYTMSQDLPNPDYPLFQEHPQIQPSLLAMYQDIDQNNPNFFLLDKDSNRVYLWTYDEMYSEYYPDTDEHPGHILDPRTGWSDYYRNYVMNCMNKDIYDGVYSDAARCYQETKHEGNTHNWLVDNGKGEWNGAVHQMLKAIEDVLDEDAITIFNNGYNYWLDVYDGRLFEWFLSDWDYTPLGGSQWLLHMQSAQEAVESGKMLFAMQYGRNDKDRMFGLASFLLIANDKSYYSFNEHSVDEDTPWQWYSEYETKIGKPSGDYYIIDDVYQRDYTKAKILVTPGDSQVKVKLGNKHQTLEGKPVREITLGARSGIILLKK